jgi:hypothetical protein
VEGDLRNFDTDSVLTKTELVDVSRSAVSLRLHYADQSTVLVNRQHTIVDSHALPAKSTALVLLSADSSGLWRYASVDHTGNSGL